MLFGRTFKFYFYWIVGAFFSALVGDLFFVPGGISRTALAKIRTVPCVIVDWRNSRDQRRYEQSAELAEPRRIVARYRELESEISSVRASFGPRAEFYGNWVKNVEDKIERYPLFVKDCEEFGEAFTILDQRFEELKAEGKDTSHVQEEYNVNIRDKAVNHQWLRHCGAEVTFADFAGEKHFWRLEQIAKEDERLRQVSQATSALVQERDSLPYSDALHQIRMVRPEKRDSPDYCAST